MHDNSCICLDVYKRCMVQARIKNLRCGLASSERLRETEYPDCKKKPDVIGRTLFLHFQCGRHKPWFESETRELAGERGFCSAMSHCRVRHVALSYKSFYRTLVSLPLLWRRRHGMKGMQIHTICIIKIRIRGSGIPFRTSRESITNMADYH